MAFAQYNHLGTNNENSENSNYFNLIVCSVSLQKIHTYKFFLLKLGTLVTLNPEARLSNWATWVSWATLNYTIFPPDVLRLPGTKKYKIKTAVLYWSKHSLPFRIKAKSKYQNKPFIKNQSDKLLLKLLKY